MIVLKEMVWIGRKEGGLGLKGFGGYMKCGERVDRG